MSALHDCAADSYGCVQDTCQDWQICSIIGQCELRLRERRKRAMVEPKPTTRNIRRMVLGLIVFFIGMSLLAFVLSAWTDSF